MIKPVYPILVLEDEDIHRVVLKTFFKENGLKDSVVFASDGLEGLEAVKLSKFSLFIIDLNMPNMGGREFVHELKKMVHEPVIIVQTSMDSKDSIIEVMKLGVFDYLLKPLNKSIFYQTLTKALEYKELKDIEIQKSHQISMSLKNQLEWLSYKEMQNAFGKGSHERNLINNLKKVMNQGAGFGSMITLLMLIKDMVQEDGDNYKVPKELMDLLFSNNDACRAMLEGLEIVQKLLEENITLSPHQTSEVVQYIYSTRDEYAELFNSKSIKIKIAQHNKDHKALLCMEKIKNSIEELLLNAYKYSVSNSEVDIYLYYQNGYFCVSVKNEVSSNPFGGIGKENEKLVLEPFIKLRPIIEDLIAGDKKLGYGFGLGLTLVNHIMKKHNGLFSIRDVMDHTSSVPKSCVIAELFFPVSG